jgi:hypothetical protein
MLVFGERRWRACALVDVDTLPAIVREYDGDLAVLEDRTLIERLIDPTEIGDLVAYVGSPLAAATNCVALPIDGRLVRNVF